MTAVVRTMTNPNVGINWNVKSEVITYAQSLDKCAVIKHSDRMGFNIVHVANVPKYVKLGCVVVWKP